MISISFLLVFSLIRNVVSDSVNLAVDEINESFPRHLSGNVFNNGKRLDRVIAKCVCCACMHEWCITTAKWPTKTKHR